MGVIDIRKYGDRIYGIDSNPHSQFLSLRE
jgi:hypothetical protein